MSSGPVARWLETFVCNSMCQQYVEVFQEFGYNNLNEICNLNAQQLLKMGIPIADTEKIVDNVSVLKQTMQANAVTQNYPTRDNHLDSMSCNYDSAPITATNVKQRKNKANKNAATTTVADSKQKQLVPNVTINQGQLNSKSNTVNNNSSINNSKEAAKKIGNDILNMATLSQTNTKYNCVPISNSNSPINYTNNTNLNYEFQQQQQQQNQFQYQQPQYRNYQQSQSPTILLSPISNPSSTSSTNSSSSNQLYNQHSPPSAIQQQQQQSSNVENNYKNQYYQQQQQQPPQYYDSAYTTNDYFSNGMHQQQYNGYNMSYTSSPYQNQMKPSYSNQYTNGTNLNKNSPLEYLERLALLPECQVVDPKSIVNDNTTAQTTTNTNETVYNNENIINNQLIPSNTSYDLNDMQQMQQKINLKRNLNEMPDLLSSPLQANTNKKVCNSSNNSNNNTYTKYMPNNQNTKLYNQQYNNLQFESANDLLSNDYSIQQNTTNNDNQINLANNIIDACNFDFLDYLPELNSTTIDQTIKTATYTTTSTNDNHADSLDDIAYSDTIYNL